MSASTSIGNVMEDKSGKRSGSVIALLRRTERSEKARARKGAFQRKWKLEREQLLDENRRLRRENESALRLLLLMTRRYEKLSSYAETLRNWIAVRTANRQPMSESGYEA